MVLLILISLSMVLCHLLFSYTISFPSHIVLFQLDKTLTNGIEVLKIKYPENNSKITLTSRKFEEEMPKNDILIRTATFFQTSSTKNYTVIRKV